MQKRAGSGGLVGAVVVILVAAALVLGVAYRSCCGAKTLSPESSRGGGADWGNGRGRGYSDEGGRSAGGFELTGYDSPSTRQHFV